MRKGQLGDRIIPGYIADRPDVSNSAKMLFGDLKKLVEWSRFRSGINYCFPSNQYLCAKYPQKNGDPLPVRTLSSWLNQLEEKGFIRREKTVYEGKTQRIIYLSEEYKNTIPEETEDDCRYEEFEGIEEMKTLWQKTATPPAGAIFLGEVRQKTAEPSAENCQHSNSSKRNYKKNNFYSNPLTPMRGDDAESRSSGSQENSSPVNPSAMKENPSRGRPEGRRRIRLKTEAELRAEGRSACGKFQNVWLTNTEKRQLTQDFRSDGNMFLTDVIDQLSAYLTHKPRYCQDNYYGVLYDWCLKKRPKHSEGCLENSAAQDYKQRNYSKEELQSLFDDLDTVSV